MFNERLVELRKLTGINQRQFAHELGISPDLYNKYERGVSRPSHETLILLAKRLKVTVDYLIGNDLTPPNADNTDHDDELWELRREMAERPEMKTLFSLGKNAKKEHLELVNNMLTQFRAESGRNED